MLCAISPVSPTTKITCDIWGSHGDEYEVYGVVGCDAL